MFEYTGATALTVFGAVTRARYVFPAPGSTLVVDPRDAQAMFSIPSLRLLRRG